ncbi:hypothetical protein ACSPX5_05325 [Pseudomonas sp. HLG18]
MDPLISAIVSDFESEEQAASYDRSSVASSLYQIQREDAVREMEYCD